MKAFRDSDCNLRVRMLHDYLVMSKSLLSRKGVSLERLGSLLEVAQAGGIMAAAQGDPNRQSLYSRQIRELEKAIGASLLDRTITPHQLTPRGAMLEQIFREFAKGFGELVAEAADESPAVRVGAGESVIEWLLLPALGGSAAKGDFRFVFRNLTSRAAAQAVRTGRVDIGVLTKHHLPGDVGTADLHRYGVAVVGRADQIARNRSISWEDLNGLPLAVLEGHGSLRNRIEALCHGANRSPRITLECTSYPQVLTACDQHGFVAVVPEVAKKTATSMGLPMAKVQELENYRIELVLAWNRSAIETRRAVEQVVRLLTKK